MYRAKEEVPEANYLSRSLCGISSYLCVQCETLDYDSGSCPWS